MRQANVEKKTAFLHKENGSTYKVRNNERCSLLCNSYFPTLVLSRSGPKGIFSVLRAKSERTPTKIIDDADLASSFFIQLSNSAYSLLRIITGFPIQFQCYNDYTRKSREKLDPHHSFRHLIHITTVHEPSSPNRRASQPASYSLANWSWSS